MISALVPLLIFYFLQEGKNSDVYAKFRIVILKLVDFCVFEF